MKNDDDDYLDCAPIFGWLGILSSGFSHTALWLRNAQFGVRSQEFPRRTSGSISDSALHTHTRTLSLYLLPLYRIRTGFSDTERGNKQM